MTPSGLRSDRRPDLAKLSLFLEFIAGRPGSGVLRLKGIFRCASVPTAVVAHGVYGWMEMGPMPQAPPHESGLLVIGRNLNLAALETGWAAVGG